MDNNTLKPQDINQDKLPQDQQQKTDESALDMMKGLHEHENHDDEDDAQ